jgi:hypothetical protein
MALVKEPRDVEDAVEEFTQVFGRPVTHAAQYYTLYYLVEIEDVDEIGFELLQKTSTLRDAFYNYSVFATAKEASHIGDHFQYQGRSISDILGNRKRPNFKMAGRSREDIEKEQREKKKMAQNFKDAVREKFPRKGANLLISFTKNPNTLPTGRTFMMEPIKTAKGLERRQSAFTSSERWLETMSTLFGAEWAPDNIPQSDRDKYGWNFQYGGDAWARVCDTALLKEEMGKQAYVDLMWSVEHNNGNFVDKVEHDTAAEARDIREAIERMETGEKELKQKRANQFGETEIIDSILPDLLTAAREEKLRFAFSLAEVTINSVSLRRHRDKIPDTSLQDEPISVFLS